MGGKGDADLIGSDVSFGPLTHLIPIIRQHIIR